MSKEKELNWFIQYQGMTPTAKVNVMDRQICKLQGNHEGKVTIFSRIVQLLESLSIEELNDLKETIKLVEL